MKIKDSKELNNSLTCSNIINENSSRGNNNKEKSFIDYADKLVKIYIDKSYIINERIKDIQKLAGMFTTLSIISVLFHAYFKISLNTNALAVAVYSTLLMNIVVLIKAKLDINSLKNKLNKDSYYIDMLFISKYNVLQALNSNDSDSFDIVCKTDRGTIYTNKSRKYTAFDILCKSNELRENEFGIDFKEFITIDIAEE